MVKCGGDIKMKWEYYRKNIINTNTTIRSDITPLFENPVVFHNLIKDLIKQFDKNTFDKIAAIDALGFVLGSVMSYKLKKPLVLIRKEKKLPYKEEVLIREYFIDYNKERKGFEIKKSSIVKGDKILIVDEWIHTGAQVKAAAKLIENAGGEVIGISTIFINKQALPAIKDYKYKSIFISE